MKESCTPNTGHVHQDRCCSCTLTPQCDLFRVTSKIRDIISYPLHGHSLVLRKEEGGGGDKREEGGRRRKREGGEKEEERRRRRRKRGEKEEENEERGRRKKREGGGRRVKERGGKEGRREGSLILTRSPKFPSIASSPFPKTKNPSAPKR